MWVLNNGPKINLAIQFVDMTGPTIHGRDDSKKERKDTMLKSMSQDLGYHISASVADSFMIPS